jgi:hypothetical protein
MVGVKNGRKLHLILAKCALRGKDGGGHFDRVEEGSALVI